MRKTETLFPQFSSKNASWDVAYGTEHYQSWLEGQLWKGSDPGGGGGVHTRKMYTPARTSPWHPYPYWHKNQENRTFPGNTICAEIHTLTGTKTEKGIPSVAQLEENQLKGHSKNNEATQKYCMQGIYSAVMAYSC